MSGASDPSDMSKGSNKADKRAHHNALERKRRDHIKDSFTVLRDSVPALNGEKVSANMCEGSTHFCVPFAIYFPTAS